jgi:hypothetical protein
VYQSKFANLSYGAWQVEADDKPKTAMTLVCAGEAELVVRFHTPLLFWAQTKMLHGFLEAL